MPHLDKIRTAGWLNAAPRGSRFILLAVCALADRSGAKSNDEALVSVSDGKSGSATQRFVYERK